MNSPRQGPASHLTSNRNVLLTRRENLLYVLLHTDPLNDAVKLEFDQLPGAANVTRETDDLLRR